MIMHYFSKYGLDDIYNMPIAKSSLLTLMAQSLERREANKVKAMVRG